LDLEPESVLRCGFIPFDVGNVDDPQWNIAADCFVDRPFGGIDRRVRSVDADNDRRR
jgi:hypothetical protein